MRCGFCLESGHEKADCPKLGVIYVRTEEPPPINTESDDAVAERMLMYRACKNGLLGYAASQGFAFPPAILQLDPDYTNG